ERQALENELLTRRVRDQLQVQAGRTMGFDPEQIKRFVRDDLEHFTERFNGVVGFAKMLESEGTSAEEVRNDREEYVYAKLWDPAITGKAAAAAASRPSRDRFVRPGLLQFEHRRLLDRPEALATIGGHGVRVVVQQLLLDTSSFAEKSAARALADELRARI